MRSYFQIPILIALGFAFAACTTTGLSLHSVTEINGVTYTIYEEWETLTGTGSTQYSYCAVKGRVEGATPNLSNQVGPCLPTYAELMTYLKELPVDEPEVATNVPDTIYVPDFALSPH